jgi:hypothetical protein
MNGDTGNGAAVSNDNWKHDTLTVVRRLGERPEILSLARVVGRWVWIEFPGAPDLATRDFLKAEGFRFNGRRRCWQHSGGRPSKQSAGDPRLHYGEVEAEKLLGAAV